MWILITSLFIFFYLTSVNGGNKIQCDNNNLVQEIIDFNTTSYYCSNSSLELYRKCCPLGYEYEVTNKKCIQVQLKPFLNESSVLIGLTTINNTILKDHIVELSDLKLEENRTLNIQNSHFLNGNYCIDNIFNTANYVVRTAHRNYEICKIGDSDKGVKCIKKCCGNGQCYYNSHHCQPCLEGLNVKNHSRIHNGEDDFALIHGTTCRKHVGFEKNFDFYLDSLGNFLIKPYSEFIYKKYEPTEEMYCLEHVDKPPMRGDYFFLCFPSKNRYKFKVTRIAMIFSCIFLILTLLIYIILSEMQNLFGKTLMSYCSALLLMFVLLTNLQFYGDLTANKHICTGYGLLIMFSGLASFAWLNIMCFDIWWTFGRLKNLLTKPANEIELNELNNLATHQIFDIMSADRTLENNYEILETSPKGSLGIQQKQREKKRFMWYSLYGWCLPIILTCITSIFHYIHTLPYYLHPYLGDTKCYFEKKNGNYGYLLFVVVPISIIFICNTYLFIKTIIYCMKVKNEINRMNDTNASTSSKKKNFIADKERMMLLIKLFTVMGISWLFETVSSVFSFEDNKTLYIIETIWDTINCLQGVFIFLIFVCKNKILEAFRKKIGIKKRRQSLSSGLTHSTALVPKVNNGKETYSSKTP